MIGEIARHVVGSVCVVGNIIGDTNLLNQVRYELAEMLAIELTAKKA